MYFYLCKLGLEFLGLTCTMFNFFVNVTYIHSGHQQYNTDTILCSMYILFFLGFLDFLKTITKCCFCGIPTQKENIPLSLLLGGSFKSCRYSKIKFALFMPMSVIFDSWAASTDMWFLIKPLMYIVFEECTFRIHYRVASRMFL